LEINSEIRTCENCMRSEECDHVGKVCKRHKSLAKKLSNIHFPAEDYARFREEWEKTRIRVRLLFGYCLHESHSRSGHG